ncbi:MAG: DUF2177 family protein [Alphaproteobacteria bacterium]|nr:DUF2177 family protein [Alphaproteobacteria bacterium]
MADAEIGLTIVPALSFAQKAAAIGGTALAFIVLDALWLGWASRDLYSGTIGSIMVQPPRWDAAVLFYLVYLAGTLYFAVLPNAAIGIGWTALQGAALGALAYATYDLTNLATLNAFTWRLAVIDIAWGTCATATAAAAGAAAARAV